jgi:hypothetical protein
MAGHLAHGDRVAGDQPDQAAPRLAFGLGIEGQRVVKVELQEPHQAGAALRLLDEGAELLVGAAGRELAEQLPDSGWLIPLKMPSRTAGNGRSLVKTWRRTTTSSTRSDAMCFLLSLEHGQAPLTHCR